MFTRRERKEKRILYTPHCKQGRELMLQNLVNNDLKNGCLNSHTSSTHYKNGYNGSILVIDNTSKYIVGFP